MRDTEQNQFLKQKIEYYKKEDAYIHIKTKQGFLYNGKITKIGESFIIFNDRYSGNIYISITEIEKIEPYKEIRGER